MYVYTGKLNKFAFVFTLCYAHTLTNEGGIFTFLYTFGVLTRSEVFPYIRGAVTTNQKTGNIMKLVRESIKLGTEYNGKWYFLIHSDNAEKLEKVEDALCAMETGASVGGEDVTWGKYCDGCPCYEDGFGSGFWVPVEEVEAFKAAWKVAKKIK